MTLPAGTRLGSYEILAPLGAGGMGEVYKARDTRLGRDVAIKVLPADRATDPDRRRRFEQEARSASALNHPNILTIHEVGSEGETTFIAMELVEGRTVRELVAAGAVPTKKLLDVAAQTAEGLAKAHGAGIVHRDLKPENLMVSKDGYVKILDFGLAKLAEPDANAASAIQTAAGSPTEPGTVLGTAGYMSPEQAAGRPVDFHSDQFALGSILYEMATGERAFQRKTGAETLVAIMREEPAPISASSPAAPAPLRWIVERCLMKDPEDRYASTKDLARDLASVRDHLSETSTSASASGAIAPVKAHRRGWLAPAIAAVAGLAAGFLLREAVGGGKPSAPPQFQQITYQRGMIFSARFAPDGQTIAYGAAWDGRPLEIYSARLDSPESRPLGLPPADVLSISKTGEMAISLNRHFLAGYESTGTLARVSLGGGAPRPILENVQDADWAPDGQTLAVARQVGNLQRLEYPIGKTIYTPSGWVSGVRVSPDGRYVAFIEHPTRGDNDGRLKIVDAEGKVRAEGPYANLGVAWSPKGDEVWSSAPFAITTLSGKTRQVLGSPGIDVVHDISKDGRMLMSLIAARREVVGVPASGEERNLTWLNWSFPTDISRDGRALLFDEQNIVPSGIYMRPLDGSAAVKLGNGYSFGFSPDGRYALTAPKPAATQLVLLPTGPGEPKVLAQSNVATQAAAIFPDGRRILVTGNEPGRGVRLYVQDIPNGKPRAITPEGVGMARTVNPISPDGKLAAAYGPDGRLALYPTEPGEPRPLPGLDPEDIVLRWSADGRSLFVFRQSAPPGRIELLDLATGKRTPWKEFRPPDPAGILQVGPAVVSPDEKSYVYSYKRLLDELYVVTNLP
ncbi:MAG TPA: protein kinase [Thermoanaerobaculia bacterium]|nr:protein kinase [Thermoanaerobaculia bacterium]